MTPPSIPSDPPPAGSPKAAADRDTAAAEASLSAGFIPREHLRIFIVAMGVSVLAASLGDVALKRGVTLLPGGTGAAPAAAHLILAAATNAWLVAGIGLMVVHFVAFVRALRLGPLSLVVPLRSTSYILTTFLAKYILQERVSPVRWSAILIILLGVAMVGRSGDERRP